MHVRYTKQQLDFLRRGYAKMPVPALTCAFNERFGTEKTRTQIKGTLANHGITCGRPVGIPKGTLVGYTAQQAAFIKTHYRTLSIVALTEAFNAQFGTTRTVGHIRAFTKNHHIASGRTGQFSKGSKPWNVGTKGLMVANAGSFKKGSAMNRLPVGAERTTKDGYVVVKVREPNVWQPKHRRVWEQAHGPVPPGMVVHFKDSDKAHCALDNLELISRGELAVLNKNRISTTPTALRPTVRLLAKLHAKKRSLLRTEDPHVEKSAILSCCGKYRYTLWRTWNPQRPYLLVVGLNPSTADATLDDPTIRRCVGFAKAWGYGGLCMVNLFAWRATDPKIMMLQADPVGPENDIWLTQHAVGAGMILAAWGVRGAHNGRDKQVLAALREHGPVYCLGVTQCGQPRHPLFIKADTRPEVLA